MADAKSVLAMAVVVMSAGTVLYTIKTHIESGTKLTNKPVIYNDTTIILNIDKIVEPKEEKTRTKRRVVTTKLGKLEGIEVDAAGKKVMAFLGLRYAKAPVGSRRFKLATPITSWKGIKPAKEFGPLCLQYQFNSSSIPLTLMSNFSEDCLHLNIWTPSLSSPLKTVILFIHGKFWFN